MSGGGLLSLQGAMFLSGLPGASWALQIQDRAGSSRKFSGDLGDVIGAVHAEVCSFRQVGEANLERSRLSRAARGSRDHKIYTGINVCPLKPCWQAISVPRSHDNERSRCAGAGSASTLADRADHQCQGSPPNPS